MFSKELVAASTTTLSGGEYLLLMVAGLTRPVVSRHSPAKGFFPVFLLFGFGLTLFTSGCGKSTPPPTATGQTVAEQIMAAWKSDTNAAVEKFLEADWSQRPWFATGNVLGYSEAQFVAIPASAKDAMSKQLMADLETVKTICRAVNTRGIEASAQGDRATAEKCFSQLKQFGGAINGPDSLRLRAMVGQAITKLASDQLAALKK